MDYYGNIRTEKRRKRMRYIKGLILIVIIVLLGIWLIGVLTDKGAGYQERVDIINENIALKSRVAELEAENEGLEKDLQEKTDYINGTVEDDTSGTTPRN